MPTPEAELMYMALGRPFGIACLVSDVNGALARCYAERKTLNDPALLDLQFKKIHAQEFWIMRREPWQQAKLEMNVK